MEDRFKPLLSSPIFNKLMQILDVSSWSCDDNVLSTSCDDEIKELTQYYEILFCQNGLDTHQISNEWDWLKSYLLSILKWKSKIDYLQIWKKTFTNKGIAAEHKNVLHINDILLITPFTNAKLERVFNRMNRINAASRNRLHNVHWGINPLKNFTSSFLPSPSP